MERRDFLKLAAGAGLYPFLRRATGASSARLQQVDGGLDRPNIIFFVFDTLSAKHMSLHGYERETTPNLAKFAERATVYHRHYAAANFTSPATASLLTGIYPWRHRAYHIRSRILQDFTSTNIFRQMVNAGYNTVAYTQNGLVEILLEQFHADINQRYPVDGWDLYRSPLQDVMFRFFADDEQVSSIAHDVLYEWGGSSVTTLLNRKRNDLITEQLSAEYQNLYPLGLPSNQPRATYFLLEDIMDQIVTEIEAMQGPFFSYFHLLPPHSPYRPNHEFHNLFQGDGNGITLKPQNPLEFYDNISEGLLNEKSRLYDEYIAFVDAEFGRLVDSLEASGVLDNSYLLFTSDHGELFERNMHGHITPFLYDGLTHIPFLIRAPQQQQRVDIHSLTSCVDVVPTLLNIIGQPLSAELDGVPLPETNAAGQTDRTVYALEAQRSSRTGHLTNATIATYLQDHKLIHYLGYGLTESLDELFNLQNDDKELTNLLTQKPGLVNDFRHLMQTELGGVLLSAEAQQWQRRAT